MNLRVTLTGLVSGIALTGTAVLADELKFTTAAPQGTPWVKGIETLSEGLSDKTGGEVSVEIFPGSQLGAEGETIKQVARGRIDMGLFSVTAVSSVVPEVTLMASPFYWDNFEEADCALDNHLAETWEPLFEAKGLKILQWQELGWQIFAAKDAITTPDQVENLKMRVAPAKNHDLVWRGLNASGVTLPFAETHAAVQTGLIDGLELPLITYVASGLGKLAPNLVETNHIYQPSLLVISQKSWDKMSDEERAAFESSLVPIEDVRQSVRGAIEFFKGKHVEDGGTIHTPTAEEKAEWAKNYTPEMQEELVESIGGEADAVWEALQAARDACRSS